MTRGVMEHRRDACVAASPQATVQNADRIVVVDESGVAEEGHHDELIAAGGIYRRLHPAQFGTLVV
jgi:ATP-binding cassette subfamily B protein